MSTPYIPGRIDFSSKALNIPTINQRSEAVYTTGPHMGESASNVDPWVKVGTTTIDGTVMQVATMLEASAWGPPVNDDEAEAHIDNFVRCGAPWLIGGRHLLPRGSHINGNLGTALIRCDIVRRSSECCEYCDRDHLTDAQRERAGECSSCSASIAAKMSSPASVKPTCPECGPHGNRGEVLLASSWAKCTTCAGGKPGDLWGEVRAEASTGVKSYTLAIGDLVFDEEAEVKRGPVTAQGELSSALIADGASSAVAQTGARAFVDALKGRLPRVSRGTLPDVLAAARVHAQDTTIYVDHRSVTAYIDTDRPLSDGAKYDIHMAAPAAVRLVFRTRSA